MTENASDASIDTYRSDHLFLIIGDDNVRLNAVAARAPAKDDATIWMLLPFGVQRWRALSSRRDDLGLRQLPVRRRFTGLMMMRWSARCATLSRRFPIQALLESCVRTASRLCRRKRIMRCTRFVPVHALLRLWTTTCAWSLNSGAHAAPAEPV